MRSPRSTEGREAPGHPQIAQGGRPLQRKRSCARTSASTFFWKVSTEHRWTLDHRPSAPLHPFTMVTIAELEQRIADNRRAGARLLTTEETLAVVALLKVMIEYCDSEAQPVMEAFQVFARLP